MNLAYVIGEKSALLLPVFVKALANHFLDPHSLLENLSSCMNEHLFIAEGREYRSDPGQRV